MMLLKVLCLKITYFDRNEKSSGSHEMGDHQTGCVFIHDTKIMVSFSKDRDEKRRDIEWMAASHGQPILYDSLFTTFACLLLLRESRR